MVSAHDDEIDSSTDPLTGPSPASGDNAPPLADEPPDDLDSYDRAEAGSGPPAASRGRVGGRRSTLRVPPQNIEAEASLLGAMLLSRDAIADALEVVSVEHFYKPSHAHVFDAICGLYAAGEPVDPVTVAEALSRADLLASLGGPGLLLELQASTPATSSAPKYARIIHEHATLRGLIGAANEIAEIGYGRPDDVIKAVDEAENLVFQVGQGRVTDSMAVIRELLDTNLDRLETLFEQGAGITGTETGYKDLDNLISGLQDNSLIIVGGRPSMGKTSFALGLAAHIGVESDLPVLLFSLEMSQLELSQRILCAEARVDSKHIRNREAR